MQQVYIPAERLKSLRKEKKSLDVVERLCQCKIALGKDDIIEITSEDAYSEFTAKNIMFAYGRGFDMKDAELLAHDDYYFSFIDIGDLISNEKRKMQMKSRVIGENGRTKKYIESVSGVKMSIYGDTVSFIGSTSQISEAETAVNTLLEGSTHKLAYSRMEAHHRKNKMSMHDPTF